MYPHDNRQTQPSRQTSHTSNNFATGYADQSQHHAAIAYPTVNPPLPNGVIGTQSSNTLHPLHYSPYPPHSSPVMTDDRRSYFASQGNAIEHYAPPQSPTHAYASAPSGQMSPQPPRHAPHPQQFIPTPSQTYQVYSSSSTSSQRSRSSVEPYYHMSPNPQQVAHSPSPPHVGRAVSHSVNPSNAVGDRYPCDLCDRSFTRLHDRRRHYETVHAPSPILHKCRYCEKAFSRADSLKRHIDNGCDEMHSNR
ncbi:hypothetical protein HYDPIDRAFT_170433 [Hydnomerulius pinastri MD-312]|uniref:C2H2-type domain-containing protein n=1 Tax=Hydnomerulius pinastri MD-312 TaxID=994086 RepID=A0A0C9WA93_9AGAM|nr:hypothetical protein HYDPIDRAFT_170433 [Hydnomerulius pinastri MD-312]